MKNIQIISLLVYYVFFCSACNGQKPFGENQLIKEAIIPMNGVKGRIDHLDVNLEEKIIYVAALGNNSLEIVDIVKGNVLHSIKGLDEPQGVAYIPQQREIFVANGGNGDCYFYNAHSFEKTATVHLPSDADDVRYDSTDKKIYVGYGSGAIAVIDARTHQQIADIKLPAHPEGFELDKQLNRLFVNIPDAHKIAVIDVKLFKLIDQWSTGEFSANFPLALDIAHHYLIIGYRHPARLVVLNEETGAILSVANMVNDVDDIFIDESAGKIFASGGGGFISIYKWQDQTLQQVANISTRDGARTSLFIPTLDLFILAARANGNKNAELQVYKTK